MEDMVLDGSVVLVLSSLGPLILGWLIFLTIQFYNNKQSIAVAAEQTRQIYVELQRLYTSVESLKTHIGDLRTDISDFKSGVKDMIKAFKNGST